MLASGNLTKPFQINLFTKLLTSTQVEHKNKNGKLCKKIWSQQHPVFPGGHPSKYWLGSMLLNFSDRTRTGVFNMIWPLIPLININISWYFGVPHFLSPWRHPSLLAYYQMALYAFEFSSCYNFLYIWTHQFEFQTVTWQFQNFKLIYDPLTV
jgi:hypothetical protein